MAKTNALSTISSDQLKNCLGSGSFGTVWSVKHPESGEEVALKEIDDVFATTARSKMIFRELKILNHLKHVNVISVLDVVKPKGLEHFHKVCIATELMYADLHRVTRSKQTFTAINIQLIFYQIVRGLRYIHSARIIHRDLKPGNILVKRNWAVKICDFGMARREMPPRSRRRMTLDVSTYYYRAPELCLYAKRYSTAVDMWAAACLLAELYRRDFLFPTDQLRTPMVLYRKIVGLLGTPSPKEIGYAEANIKRQVSKWSHQESKLNTLRDISPLVTDEVVDLLSKLLRYDPSSRLSAEDLLKHSYLGQGRKIYHRYMCDCCSTSPSGLRLHAVDLEPVSSRDFDDRWERSISSVEVAKRRMFKYLNDHKTLSSD